MPATINNFLIGIYKVKSYSYILANPMSTAKKEVNIIGEIESV